MRLVCPNCSAQYEIDGSMIPDEGRDVQCSNCGHTWFELPAPTTNFEEIAPEADVAVEASDETIAESDTDDEANADAAFAEPEKSADAIKDIDAITEREVSEIIEAYVDPDDDLEVEPEPAEEEDSPSNTIAAAAMAALLDKAEGKTSADDPTAKKPRRAADVAALEILREEAEREMTQRRGDVDVLETQTDLGLDDLSSEDEPSRALKARMAHLGDEDAEATVRQPSAPPVSRRPSTVPERSEAESYAEPRRDLLPDIDEINSTLKPASVESTEGKSGFLTGFLVMVVAAFLLILAYAQAPFIVQLFPESEAMIISYVDQANAFRDWLQGLLNG
ncbi:MAG: zinc-ribbon domain-containing protein [Pseudomonadota bacterium]